MLDYRQADACSETLHEFIESVRVDRSKAGGQYQCICGEKAIIIVIIMVAAMMDDFVIQSFLALITISATKLHHGTPTPKKILAFKRLLHLRRLFVTILYRPTGQGTREPLRQEAGYHDPRASVYYNRLYRGGSIPR